ncbi:RHS repeat protein [Paraburkholderia phytofirmans]|uniref:RHS repeat protein n=1 Tax=Paraburkholderia phytofirmans TaxID=261302 RepID=A0ABW9BK22_9BURK|nr:RHS repeat domain-containing protein [Paraburkholderia phytofirmans]
MVSLFRSQRGLLSVWRVASGGAVACLLAVAISAHADEITYGYDALGRLTSVSVGGATAYYDYDAAGNITAIRRPLSVSSEPSVRDQAPSLPFNAQASVSALASAPTSSR